MVEEIPALAVQETVFPGIHDHADGTSLIADEYNYQSTSNPLNDMK